MKKRSQLLLATNNKGKIEEIQAILEDLNLELLLPNEVGLALDIEEDGNTYIENASKKALGFAQASGFISLADDSGLEVNALGGAPGLYSARYAPTQSATDADRRAYLLNQLNGIPRPWKAQFRATVAIARPGGTVKVTEGICPGEIIPEERGEGGFGYDPVFLVKDKGLTMAQFAMSEKNRISHRGQAIQNAIPYLMQLFGLLN